MFGIDGGELLVIAIIALIVLGPERLPKAARFAGLWVRRARAQWYSVKSELERELASEELKRSLRDTRQAVADINADVRAAESEARREFDTMQAQLQHSDDEDEDDHRRTQALDDTVAGPVIDTHDDALADDDIHETTGRPDDRR